MKAVGLTRYLPITDPESLRDEVYIPAALGVRGVIASIILWMNEIVAKKPVSLSMTQSAAIPPDGDTAYEALFEPMGIAQDGRTDRNPFSPSPRLI
ncbi:MAG: hypothetical protein H0W49_05910 [Nitrospirales bacterium]|nr:hypothetical protein [Nitrospirales bacterium]MBA3964873.1 hypothetical protein [Nitrospirales bacterium]